MTVRMIATFFSPVCIGCVVNRFDVSATGWSSARARPAVGVGEEPLYDVAPGMAVHSSSAPFGSEVDSACPEPLVGDSSLACVRSTSGRWTRRPACRTNDFSWMKMPDFVGYQ